METPPTDPSYIAYPREGDHSARARAAVAAYRDSNRATLCYLGVIVVYLLAAAVAAAGAGSGAMVAPFAVLVIFAVLAVQASQSASRALGTNVAVAVVATILLIFVPCGALLVLFWQQSRLGRVLKAAGIKVGLAGPNKADLQRVLGD